MIFFSDRFRTAINVFGDSIGCAVVHHLSRKELDTLDYKRTSIDDSNINHSKSTAALIPPNYMPQLNHVTSPVHDNPTFSNQTETIFEDDNATARTNL